MERRKPEQILKETREAKGITQTEMAARIASALKQTYSMRQYQRLEEGEFPKYKKQVVLAVDRILGTNVHDIVYDEDVPRGTFGINDKSLRKPKIATNEETEGITFIPISAQGGYSKRTMDPIFTDSLEKLYIPGFPYRGDRYRVWEVEGNSMEPTFKEGFYVLTEKIDPEDWKNVKEYHAYVIVTVDSVLLKRVFAKNKSEWVMISDNDKLYPQFKLPINEVKELWFVKRKMDWEMSPPKKFEIKV